MKKLDLQKRIFNILWARRVMIVLYFYFILRGKFGRAKYCDMKSFPHWDKLNLKKVSMHFCKIPLEAEQKEPSCLYKIRSFRYSESELPKN
jgi:hypothetical protein